MNSHVNGIADWSAGGAEMVNLGWAQQVADALLDATVDLGVSLSHPKKQAVLITRPI